MAAEQLIRAKEGAQISAEMYTHLRQLFPKATDEPEVFQSNLARFETELRAAMETAQRRGVTPRGKSGFRLKPGYSVEIEK